MTKDFLYLYFIYFIVILLIKTRSIQINLDSNQWHHMGAISTAIDFLLKDKKIEKDLIKPVALYQESESYNQRFYVVVARKFESKIELVQVHLYMGKSTSGNFVIIEWRVFENEENLSISKTIYRKIQKEIINELRKENIKLKYLKSVIQIEDKYFIVHPVYEGAPLRYYILNLDSQGYLRIPCSY